MSRYRTFFVVDYRASERLEGLGEDQIAALLAADVEDPGTRLGEAVAVIKGNGAEVGGMRAEEEPRGAKGTRIEDGGIH